MDNQKIPLQMKNISISFPGVKALSDVGFSMKSGDTYALIGANGAGKSTLMKVLSGAYSHYTGDIFIDGEQKNIREPKDAKKLGIEIVYQEVDTALIPYLNVAENIMLNSIVNRMEKKQFVNWSQVNKKASEVLKRFNLNLDIKRLVSDLTLAQKQMVLISRAVVEDCRFLILDEPTAPLSNTETLELFRIVKELTSNNVGIIFISHRIPELFEICKYMTIMRDGKNVIDLTLDESVTPKIIVEYMLGRNFEETFPKKKVPIGETLFEVKNLTEKEDKIKNVSFFVKKGEIVGISGLVGAGKTELCKTLFGVYKHKNGEVLLNNKKITIKNPSTCVKEGLALVPEERRKEGVLVSEPVYVNISAASLGNFTKFLGIIDRKKESQKAVEIIKDLGVKTPSENQKVANLSGGNQQKIAVGKWLVTDAEVYIFDEPTKGVDVGAKHDIFTLIEKLAELGKGIIYASCELAEIRAITDRTYVMYDGMIQKELITENTNDEEILYYSTGGK